MRFSIEQRHITDASGKPITGEPAFYTVDAETAEEAVRLQIKRDDAELMGDIREFPGFHAVATIKSRGGVYTLQVAPASQSGLRR